MRLGSVTAAAKALYISQPSVSRLLNDLEISIDVELFEHCKGRLSPTREAELLYDEVERSFAGLNAVRKMAQQLKDLNLGTLRLGATPALSLDVVSRAIAAFSLQYETANTSFWARSSHRIAEWTSTYQIDLGIVSSFFDRPWVRCIDKFCFQCVVVLPEGHRLTDRQVLTCDDLEGESIVSLERDFLLGRSGKNKRLETLLRRQARFETETGFIACQLVRQGLGIAIVDPFTAYHFNRQGLEIRRIDLEIPFYFSIIHAENRQPSLITQKFLPNLLEQIKIICREDFVIRLD
jgi:DNA-binding transcriptional LysR family regulator